MEKAARALGRIQDEMQARIDRALLRPSACNSRNSIHRLGWLESFEQEGYPAEQPSHCRTVTRS